MLIPSFSLVISLPQHYSCRSSREKKCNDWDKYWRKNLQPFHRNLEACRLSMMKTIEFFLCLTGVFITASLQQCSPSLPSYMPTVHFQLDNYHFSYLFWAVTCFICLVLFAHAHYCSWDSQQPQFCATGQDYWRVLILEQAELRWAQFILFSLKVQGVVSFSVLWFLALY